jgi:hypothetical protein
VKFDSMLPICENTPINHGILLPEYKRNPTPAG